MISESAEGLWPREKDKYFHPARVSASSFPRTPLGDLKPIVKLLCICRRARVILITRVNTIHKWMIRQFIKAKCFGKVENFRERQLSKLRFLQLVRS